jgi:hypothetical protein
VKLRALLKGGKEFLKKVFAEFLRWSRKFFRETFSSTDLKLAIKNPNYI